MMEDSRLVYHEAGHVIAAIWLGGRVECVTVEPERDDGPQREGEVRVRWYSDGLPSRDVLTREILVCLAGPAAEMIHLGERPHPSGVQEWREDWGAAWRLAGEICPDARRRTQLLEMLLIRLCGFFDADVHWQAVAETADLLDAHGTLEGDMVSEVFERWIGRTL